MPNLVGLRDGSSPLSLEDQAKNDTLVAMQMEALGLKRRDLLSTTDFKENKASYVPTGQLESHRLVNKSSIGKRQKTKLDGWNNAWTSLQDDGTDAQNLQAVNEGLGQTHRAKLMSDDSIRDYTGEEKFRRGRDTKGSRGNHIGRGGDNVRRATGHGGRGKAKGERRVTFQNEILIQPITRVRVLKGDSTAQPDVSRRQPFPILKTAPAMKPTKGNMTTPSAPAASVRRSVRYEGAPVLAEPSAFMAFAGIRKEHKRDEAAIKVAPSDANVSEDEANKRTIDNTITPITSASNEKATAPKSNAIIGTPSAETNMAVDKPGSRPKANLMDLDMGQETTQPVLQFTAPRVEEQPSPSFDQLIEKLTESAHLSPAQMKILKSIQVQVHEREKVDTPVSEAPRPETYTRSELESLRPKAAAPRVTTGTKTAAPRVTTGTKTAAPKVTTGIAKKLAEERDAFFIGEHVHKTRFHKTAASLTENFQKLTISDNTPVQATAASLPTIGNPTIDNPEDEVISDETSVEATAASLPTIEYPVKKLISVEKEKSKTNPFGPPLDKRKGPSLPVHPLTQSVTENHAATTRNQYSGIGPPPDKRNGPSLPAHLLAQATTMDQGAAVRNQYLGVGRLPVNGKDPSLSAHLLAQSATADHGAVPRDQYTGGNSVLTSISNQQSAEDTTLSMRPTRRNMINQSGFYALTENRVTSVAAGKKGEDPLLVARKRGL